MKRILIIPGITGAMCVLGSCSFSEMGRAVVDGASAVGGAASRVGGAASRAVGGAVGGAANTVGKLNPVRGKSKTKIAEEEKMDLRMVEASPASPSRESMPDGPDVAEGIAAVVNGSVITRSEVDGSVIAQLRSMKTRGASKSEIERLRKESLNDLIDRELILSEFKKMGGELKSHYVDNDVRQFINQRFGGNREEFLKELRSSGMTTKQFKDVRRKMLVSQYMRGQQVSDLQPPTPQEVKDYYSRNLDDYRDKDYVRLRTIMIPKFSQEIGVTTESQRKLTEELRQKILGGADFSALARTYSQDSVSTEGGLRGTIDRTMLNSDLTDIAFELPVGRVSNIVETRNNYYLLLVENKQKGNAIPLSKVRKEVEQRVLQEKRKASVDRWLVRLRRNAVIKKF